MYIYITSNLILFKNNKVSMELWVDVFKVGEHTDSEGTKQVWSEDDIATIVETYNNQDEDSKHIAPIVLGHPETDAPAYGWVESLKQEGTTLKAKLVELSEDLIEGIKKGLYKFQSIALYPNLLLRHLGILGAVPPAVKGLKPLNEYFSSDAEYKTIYFGEKDTLTIDKIKLYIKEKYGLDDLQIMLKDLFLIKNEDIVETNTNEFSEKEFTEKKFNEMKEQMKALENKNEELAFDLFFNELVREEYLVPAQKELVKSLYIEGFKFNEDGRDFTKKEAITKFIKSFPKQISYSDIANKEKETEISETDAQIKILTELIRGGK